jgi:hypothetical protein
MAQKATLYEIATEFAALEEMLMNDDGEVTTSHEELEKYANQMMVSKVDDYCFFVQKLEDEADLASQHIKRLQAYKNARENAIERLRMYSALCLEKLNQKAIKGTLGSISLRAPSKVLRIEDESKVGDEFCSYKRIVDTSTLKEAVKSGLEVEGVSLVDGKKSVLIKMKGVK